MAHVTHLAFPFRLDYHGSPEVVDQDSLEDVSQCVRVLVSTVRGERLELPEYGLPDPVFAPDGMVADGVARAVERWEPRVANLAIESSWLTELVRRHRIEVS